MKRSIYISRKVLNGEVIHEWAKTQGFRSCVPQQDMHVTVAFDKRKHDWRDLPLYRDDGIDVVDPDERSVSLFRNGAVVIEIFSTELTARWAELLNSGLHWKHADYRPHITFTYDLPEGLDPLKVAPFDGVIKLGPEVVTDVIWQMRKNINEEIL